MNIKNLLISSTVIIGTLGLSACGGGGGGSNVTSKSEVEDQILGYFITDNGSNITINKFAVEKQGVVETEEVIYGKPFTGDFEFTYDGLTDSKSYTYEYSFVNNKYSSTDSKVTSVNEDEFTLTHNFDKDLLETVKFASADISGKKITEVIDFDEPMQSALNSLQSTKITFGNQQSCKYFSQTQTSKAHIIYDEVFKENATESDLEIMKNSFLTGETDSGTWLGKSWYVEKNYYIDNEWKLGLILDNGTIYDVEYYPAGKFEFETDSCQLFSEQQKIFIEGAIAEAAKSIDASGSNDDDGQITDQVLGYEFGGGDDYLYITKIAIENGQIVSDITELYGTDPYLGDPYSTDDLTDTKKFKLVESFDNGRYTNINDTIIYAKNNIFKQQNNTDKELIQTITFDKQDLSGKKITDVVFISDDIVSAVNALPSTQNTFDSQESCLYATSSENSKPYIEYGRELKTNATERDLNSFKVSSLSDNTISGTWLGKAWFADKNPRFQFDNWSDGLLLDSDTLYDVQYFHAGKFEYKFEGCELFTKEQADFIQAAIKAATQ